MNQKLQKVVTKLSQEAKNSGQAEYKTLMEFFEGCCKEDSTDKELLLGICDEFVGWARYIKREISNV